MVFDQKKWADESKVYLKPYPRQQMLPDLLKTVLKVGMLRDDLTSKLGPATKTEKFSDHDLVYVLGPEPGAISIDSQWLTIDFDATQRVKRFEVLTD